MSAPKEDNEEDKDIVSTIKKDERLSRSLLPALSIITAANKVATICRGIAHGDGDNVVDVITMIPCYLNCPDDDVGRGRVQPTLGRLQFTHDILYFHFENVNLSLCLSAIVSL